MNAKGESSAVAWTYRTYDPNNAPQNFGPLSPMVSLWKSKWSASGRFPAWRDFDFLDFEGWWGRLSLGELQSSPFDLRWVLWGTKLVGWWGHEYTGQLVSQQPYLGETWQKYERPYLQELRDKRLIGFISGTLAPQQREFYCIHGVDLPLEQDGDVTHIFSAYALRERCEEFVPAAPPVSVL